MAVSETTHAERSGESKPRRRLPYQALYAIAAGFVVLAIVLVLLALNRGSNSPSTVPPPASAPATVSSPTNSTTPSASPTSPDDQAAAAATAAYVAYMKALNVLSHSGGAPADLAAAKKLTTTTGTERPYLTGPYVKELRQGKFRTAGWSKVTSRVNAIERGDRPPRVDLTACIDQRGVTVTKAGKPFTPPKFLRYGVNLRLIDGNWLVDRVENVTADLDPQEMTSCEP